MVVHRQHKSVLEMSAGEGLHRIKPRCLRRDGRQDIAEFDCRRSRAGGDLSAFVWRESRE